MSTGGATFESLLARAEHAEAELSRVRTNKDKYKFMVIKKESEIMSEKQRADAAERRVKTWRIATAAVAVLLSLVLALHAGEPELDAVQFVAEKSDSGEYEMVALAQMPEHVWSTGIVFNGNTAGSAVIISPTGEGLSCGHCFRGVVGGKFTIRRPDGTDVEAELLDHIPHRGWGPAELCLFRIDPEDVISFSQICLDEQPDAEIDIIGYPMTHGPVYHPLVELKDQGSEMRVYRVTDGQYVMSGNSGSPIFRNGTLDAIVAGVNNDQAFAEAEFELAGWRRQARRQGCQQMQDSAAPRPKAVGINAVATKRETLIEFVRHNAGKFRHGNQPFCGRDGTCYDAQGNPLQKQPAAKPAQPGAAPMQPNLPMPNKPYAGKGRPPKDLNGNRNQAKEIDKLRHAPPPVAPHGNTGEVAPPDLPAPVPMPSPPDLSIHTKLDALLKGQQLAPALDAQSLIGRLDQLLGRPTPDLSTIEGKLDALRQGVQDAAAVKGKLQAIHQDVADLEAGRIDPEKLKADIFAGIPNLLVPMQKKIDAMPGGLAKTILENAPAVGEALAANAAPQLKAAATAGVSALIPGAGTLAAIAALLAGIPTGGFLLSKFLNRNKPPDGGGGLSPDLVAALGRLQQQIANLKGQPQKASPRAPQAPPAAVPFTAPPALPPAKEVINTAYAQTTTEIGTVAYQRAKADLIEKNPQLARSGLVKQLDSLFTQHLSGLQPAH